MHKKEPFALLLACIVAAPAYADDLHVLGHVRSHKLDILAEGGAAWCAPHLKLHLVLQPDSPDVANQTALAGIMKRLAKPISVDCPTAQDATLTVEAGSQALGSYRAAAANAWAFTAIAPPPPVSAESGPLDVLGAKPVAVAFVDALKADEIEKAKSMAFASDPDWTNFLHIASRIASQERLRIAVVRATGLAREVDFHLTGLDTSQAIIEPNAATATKAQVSILNEENLKHEDIEVVKDNGIWKVAVKNFPGMPTPEDMSDARVKDLLFALIDGEAASMRDIAHGIETGVYTGQDDPSALRETDGDLFREYLTFAYVFTTNDKPSAQTKAAGQDETEASQLRALAIQFGKALDDEDFGKARSLSLSGQEKNLDLLRELIAFQTAQQKLDIAFRKLCCQTIEDGDGSVKQMHDLYFRHFISLGRSVTNYGSIAKRDLAGSDIARPLATLLGPVIKVRGPDFRAWFGNQSSLSISDGTPLRADGETRRFDEHKESQAFISRVQFYLSDCYFFKKENGIWKIGFVKVDGQTARDAVLGLEYGGFHPGGGPLELAGATNAGELLAIVTAETVAIDKLTALLSSGDLKSSLEALVAIARLPSDVESAAKSAVMQENDSDVAVFLKSGSTPITALNPMVGKWRPSRGDLTTITETEASSNGSPSPAKFTVIGPNEVELFSSERLTDLVTSDGGQICYFSDQNHMFCPNFKFRSSGYYVRLGSKKQ